MAGVRVGQAGVGLAALVAAAALAGCDKVKAGLHDAVRDEAAASIDALPADSVIGELRADFPQDYARLRALASDQAAGPGGVATVKADSAAFMKSFYATHEADAEQAPASDLQAVTAANLRVLQAAQAMGEQACSDLWASGRAPDGSSSTPELKAALQSLGRTHVKAIRAGLDHPAGRGAARMERQDATAMVAAAGRFGVTPQQIIHGEAQTADVRCRTGVAVYRGMETLAPEPAARLQAYMLRVAFKDA